MNYRETHYSTHDGSPAMLVQSGHGYVTMMNECGDVWVDLESAWSDDPSWQWEAPNA